MNSSGLGREVVTACRPLSAAATSAGPMSTPSRPERSSISTCSGTTCTACRLAKPSGRYALESVTTATGTDASLRGHRRNARLSRPAQHHADFLGQSLAYQLVCLPAPVDAVRVAATGPHVVADQCREIQQRHPGPVTPGADRGGGRAPARV